MAKFNEGDIIEGIFAIAISYLLADGKVDKAKVNSLRAKIEPTIFASGSYTYDVAKNVERKKGTHPADTFNVKLVVRLKEASVSGAFGKEYKMLYSKSGDIGNIDKKIDTLIESANSYKSSFSKRLLDARDNFLENNKQETVNFEVIADGIAGESSGGNIKADIMVNIEAVTSKGRQKVFSESIPFSLKSESVTVANLSPYKGMMDIAKAFGIQWDNIAKYDFLKQKAMSTQEKLKRFDLIEKMYAELKRKIVAATGINVKAYNFLEKSIFGSDYAEVVDVRKNELKEITRDYFAFLKKNVTLDATSSGQNIVFVNKTSKEPIFQLRTKLRREANEAKFYLEVGKGIYAPKIKAEKEAKAKAAKEAKSTPATKKK